MIGGKVECVSQSTYGDRPCWRVIVVDRKDCLGIYVSPNPGLMPGDGIWWNGKVAYWTPRNGQGNGSDIQLTEYGPSFDPFFKVPDE